MSEATTRERIEQSAAEAFARLGVDGATTRDIAAGARLSEGALYRHFPSKDAMAAALFERIHARLAALIDATRGQPIRQGAAAIVAGYCAAADDDWTLFRFHLLNAHRFMPGASANPVAALERRLADAMAAEEIPHTEPALLAGLAMGPVHQTALQIAYGRLEGPLSRWRSALSVAVLGILSVKEQS
jgi:AcrR family transcriptional regulator